jgi:predicted alpha/beta-fold hydrolase
VLANPWDLLHSSHLLNGSWFSLNVYSKKLASNLVRLFQKHRAAFANETDINFDDIADVC